MKMVQLVVVKTGMQIAPEYMYGLDSEGKMWRYDWLNDQWLPCRMEESIRKFESP